MSDTTRIGLAGLCVVATIGSAWWWAESSKTTWDGTESAGDRRGQCEVAANGSPASYATGGSKISQPMTAPGESAAENLSGRPIAGPAGAETPGWTIPYGKEFWRRSGKPRESKAAPASGSPALISADIDLGDIIDRVSHAMTTNDSSAVPRVQAKAYTAVFDGAGMHFSPHRPRASNVLKNSGAPPTARSRDSDGRNADFQSAVSPNGIRPTVPHPETETTLASAADCQSAIRQSSTLRYGTAPRQPRNERRNGLPPVGEGRFHRPFPLPDPGTAVTLRTRSVRCGAEILYERDKHSLNWAVLGNTAQALLDESRGLVEHYEAGGEGVEVSWVLKKRPTVEGPLEIEFEATGLRYAATSDRGLHLADSTGTPRARIGKAVAVDSAGYRTDVTLAPTEAGILIRVPGAILAQAAYPLAIDPLVSPEFGTDEPILVPRPGEHALPAVAWNGTNWLVVWTEWPDFESPVNVVGARVSRGGRVLDPFGITISTSEQPPAAPSVASNGKDYFAVWEHWDRANGLDLYGAQVTASGQVADQEPLVINSLAFDQFSPSVSGGSDGYMIVWQDRRSGGDLDIYGTRVSNEGIVLDGVGFPVSTAAGDQFSPAVAHGPGGLLAVWRDARTPSERGHDLFGTRLTSNGTVLDTGGIPICTVSIEPGAPSVAGGSAGYLVVWHDGRNSTVETEQTDIYGTLVSPAGVMSDPQGIPVSTAGDYQLSPSVAAGGSGFLVVWNDSRSGQPAVYAARLSPAGVVLEPDGILVDSVPRAYTPVTAASDNGFLVVWDRSSRIDGGFGATILGARLSSQAEVLDDEKLLITAKDNDQSRPAVASNGKNWFVVWEDWRDPNTWDDIYGVRIRFDCTPLDTAAIAISTQAGFEMAPSVASAGGDYLAVWIDDRNSGYPFTDIYGARIRSDGTVQDPGGIAICTAPAAQSHPRVGSDGTNYLVVWDDGRTVTNAGIYGARVKPSGVVFEPDGFPVSASVEAASTPAVAYNGKDFLVVWTEWHQRPQPQHDIWGARVDPAGAVLDPTGIAISLATNAQTHPTVASSGGDFLVIWADTRHTVTNGGITFGGHIYGSRINAEGGVLDRDGFLVSTSAFNASPNLSFDGAHFVVVWDHGIHRVSGPTTEVRAARIDSAGQVLLTDAVINTNGTYKAYPTIAAGPSKSVLIVGERLLNGSSRLFGHLVSFADPPLIESLRVTGSVATLTWRSEPEVMYRVQFTPELPVTNWFDLEPVVTAKEVATSFLDPTIGATPQRFYRVLRLP